MERVVIVGAGLAGHSTAVALRQHGYAGELVLLGAEPHPPYDRPPLSKALLRGEVDDTTLAADWAALAVDLRLGVAAIGLRDGAVEVEGGAGPLDADAVVLACGAVPVVPPGMAGDPRVRTLRTVDDARRLRGDLRPGTRVAVVGAGWIGAEVATAAAAAGCRVTVHEALAAPLAAALPAEVGVHTVPWYAEHGIDLRLGETVGDVDELGADLAVVGIGVRPATDWLAGSGVDRDARGAVRTDAGLRASRPATYAVGDCATWLSRRYGRHVHVEHWDDALRAPSVVAANLAANAGGVHDPVPYFWSEQLGRRVQYAGHHPAADPGGLVWRGDPSRDATWAACWLRAGDDGAPRLAALLTVDRPRDLLQGRHLAERGTPVDPLRLADPSTPLKRALA